MCDVPEWGDGAAAVSGWSKKGGERKILGGWIQTRGLFCRLKAPVCLEQMDYCLLSPGEWVLRVFLVPRVAHSLSHTSPLCLLLSLGLCYTLFCLLLFCASLCISLLLTFSHTKTDRLFSLFFWREGVIFLHMGCFVLFQEQVARLVVTGEECWVELFQPVRWLSLPKDWM